MGTSAPWNWNRNFGTWILRTPELPNSGTPEPPATAISSCQPDDELRADLALGPLPVPVRFTNALVDGLRQASESLVGAAIVVLQIVPTLMVWMLVLAWPTRWVWRRVRA
jgi:hypothetical protein